jgi:hypothetical protein
MPDAPPWPALGRRQSSTAPHTTRVPRRPAWSLLALRVGSWALGELCVGIYEIGSIYAPPNRRSQMASSWLSYVFD